MTDSAAPSLATVRQLFAEHRRSGCTDKCHTDEVTEWLCPSTDRWTDCPGPCRCGAEHTETRTIPRLFHHIEGLFR